MTNKTDKISKNSTPPPKIAAVHDISCIGRCAQTALIPILSHMGLQAVPLPSALLSTQTDGFSDFSFLDLSSEMKKIISHWKSIGLSFDAVYSGFLGNEKQIETVNEFFDYCKGKNEKCLLFVDPVMGDNGQKYKTYTEKMCDSMKKLVRRADVITPNVTEACLLLGIPYKDDFGVPEITQMLSPLRALGPKTVIITGVASNDCIGAVYLESEKYGSYFSKRAAREYPGSGDIFASIVLSEIMNAKTLDFAVQKACEFIYISTVFTEKQKTPLREGLAFEGLLHLLDK
jgi:pyridoxine kinase